MEDAHEHLEVHPDFKGDRVSTRISSVPLRGHSEGGGSSDGRAQQQSCTYSNAIVAPMANLFSYAIPTEAAVAMLVALGLPVVSLWSGAGYWASLLERAGAAVDAYDPAPPVETWATVKAGGWEEASAAGAAARSASSSAKSQSGPMLLLVAPHSCKAHADAVNDVLAAFAGAKVALVGPQEADKEASAATGDGSDSGGGGGGGNGRPALMQDALLGNGMQIESRLQLPCWLITRGGSELVIWARNV